MKGYDIFFKKIPTKLKYLDIIQVKKFFIEKLKVEREVRGLNN